MTGSLSDDADEIRHLSSRLGQLAGSARNGLPKDIFLLVSSLTPLVNVDLLIRNQAGQTLLTWRHDEFYGPGWHVPGGIVRFKETFAERIHAVAQAELGVRVSFEPQPLSIKEVMAEHRDTRGHFISFLHECTLLTPPDPTIKFSENLPKNGYWRWHDHCPDNLIRVHEMYRPYL